MFTKRKHQPNPAVSLSAPAGVFDDAKGEFAEIYGTALVGGRRMFLLALIMGVVALAAVLGMWSLGGSNVAVPWIVEVSREQGVVSKPVRIENMRPADAFIQAELGKWATKVFTIDSALSNRLFSEANTWTKGLGTSQFTEFRVKQNVIDRMTKDPTLQRTVEVQSVDSSQPGVAFIFLRTQEAYGSNANAARSNFRVTVKYELVPPTTSAEIQANPLGIFITSMNVTEEGGK